MKSAVRSRAHPGFWAFIVHRVSGLLLALFLPLHFWLLSQALHGPAALDGILRWVDRPAFKLAEWGLVVLLAAHLAGGVRVLMLEFLPWRNWQKALLVAAAGCTIAAGAAVALNLV
ncbi:MAG: succinate dehydrogenase, cytochrome b556 subunit [Betaproteobacteria bacterium]|nr:succinate dehydrogenase, cytochrome b556 subunit [Betaproteobacteria bacterium]